MVSESDAVRNALLPLRPFLGHAARRQLEEQVNADPDAYCRDWNLPDEQPVPPEQRRYAGSADWYHRGEPVTLQERRYAKYGLRRTLMRRELETVGEYRGVPVYAESGVPGPPEVIYLPARSRCEFQPYRLEPVQE